MNPRRLNPLLLPTLMLATLTITACGADDPVSPANRDANNGANNGTNNGATNNGATNNGATNNGATNNGATNNGATNNGATNNGATNNGATNNGATNNGAEGLTYYKHVKAILDRNCTGCHVVGGVGPFPLDTWEAVQPLAATIEYAVMNNIMPPWHPDPDCKHLKGERVLAEADKQLISDWVAGGALEGDPADDPHVGAPGDTVLANPSRIVTAAAPYTADGDRPDDYRCQVLDIDFAETTYLAAYQVVPDQKPIVHHALFYLVPPGEVGRLAELEARDPEPGYECFGGPKVGNLLNTIAGWVPGSTPTHFPPGAAYAIPAGAKIVMQVHYNTLVNPAAADRTALHMKYYEGTPDYLVQILPMPNTELQIDAGDADSAHELTIPNIFGESITLVGTAPHMHMLGSKIHVEVRHGNGDRTCLVDIPRWDFNWQQFYEFNDDDYVQVAPGDSLYLKCTYDNSAANQPVVNGEQLEPRDVSWGDGSLDEMCLNYLTTIKPFDPNDIGGDCGAFPACNQSCDPTDGACTLSCASNGGGICRECFAQATVQCSGRYCNTEQNAMIPCALGCLNESDLGACFAARCPAQLDAYWSCMSPHVYNGDCNNNLDDCNVTF